MSSLLTFKNLLLGEFCTGIFAIISGRSKTECFLVLVQNQKFYFVLALKIKWIDEWKVGKMARNIMNEYGKMLMD
jgi:hypothetical protein